MSNTADDSFARGMETLAKVFPPELAGFAQFQYPPEIEKDWGQLAISTVLGKVWSRPGLELKHRSMITIAALTALNRPDQLKAYIAAGLHLGLTRTEVCEIIMQMAVYAGFPAAIQAFTLACEVFEQLDRASNPA